MQLCTNFVLVYIYFDFENLLIYGTFCSKKFILKTFDIFFLT